VSDIKGETEVARAAGRWFALRDALVVGQVALTAVLLVVAGLLLRSLGASQRADVGLRTDGLALVSFDTDMVRYAPERGERFWIDALARVRALPGVESAGTVSPTTPFEINFNQQEMQPDSRTYAEGQRAEIIENVSVSPGYLSTLGVRLLEGRDIADTDRQGSLLVAVINETMARAYWPNQRAVGRTFRLVSTNRQYAVVGVAADYTRHTVLEAPAPFVHFAGAQRPSTYNTIVARTRGDAAALVATIRRELVAMEPSLVFVLTGTMDGSVATSLLPVRVGAWLASAFGALGTLLAAIGLYGVIAYTVGRRTREIGVRMALGARPGDVLRMVVGQGFTLVGAGLVIGLCLALAAARLLAGLLYGVSAIDPASWMAALSVLGLAALAANLVPARRAMRIDPMRALRAE
jgi:predicted permease